MAKLPLILSIVALICATGLGIAAKGKADQKMRELASTRTELKQSEATVGTRTTELARANQDLATAGKEIEARVAEVAKLSGDVKTSKDELAAIADTVKQQKEKLVELDKELTDAKKDVADYAADKLKLEAELADAQKEAAEKKLAFAVLEDRLKAAEHSANPAQKSARGATAPSPNLTGSVLAVNEGLNFLVLSVGDRQGVSVNTSMLVVRGGQRVATLKVTSIEPRTSIAEVVPGTLARGQAVQTGDQVVLVRGERKPPGVVPTKGSSAPSRADLEPALPEA
jgi:ABC-type transporter Mla subunit MlaD